MKILNTFSSDKTKIKFFDQHESQIVFSYRDYKIIKQFDKSFLYAYKSIAFNQLAGLNKSHLIRVADCQRPLGKYSPSTFLYDQGFKTLLRGIELNNDLKSKQLI
jgi:hypothetical protein